MSKRNLHVIGQNRSGLAGRCLQDKCLASWLQLREGKTVQTCVLEMCVCVHVCPRLLACLGICSLSARVWCIPGEPPNILRPPLHVRPWERYTHARQRNISGPAGAIYLSPSRFKILIKINLTQFTHSAICLFIRIMLITSVGQKNYYPFCT